MLSDQGTRCALVRARPDEDEAQYAARATVNVLSMRGAGGLAIRLTDPNDVRTPPKQTVA